MVDPWRRLWLALRSLPTIAALGLALAVVVLLGGGLAGRHLWAAHHFRAAQEALAHRDQAAARRHLAHCLAVWPDSVETHLLAAQAARRAELYEEAQAHLEAVERLQVQGSDAATLEWALLNAQRGDLNDNIEKYLQSCSSRNGPEAVEALEALARGYLAKQLLSPAMYTLNLWLARDPNNRQALMRRAWIYQRMEKSDDALADLRRAFTLDPDDDEYRLYLASLLLDTNLHKEAVPHFERLYEHQPQNPEVLLGLARCRRSEGRLEETRRLLDRLLASVPPDSQPPESTLTERGKVAYQEGKWSEAESWLRQAVAWTPYDYAANFTLHQCLQQLGKKDDAKRYLEEAERISKDQSRLRILIKELANKPFDLALCSEAGVLFLRNGQEKEGIQLLETALQQDPQNAPACQALKKYHEKSRAGQSRTSLSGGR